MKQPTILRVRVVPWDVNKNLWGIELTFADHYRAFQVGTRSEAEAQAKTKTRSGRFEVLEPAI